MIYRIKFVSDEVNNFYRILEIDSEAKFIDLRNAILDSVGYSHDYIDSFAMCNDEWEPREEIVMEDLGMQSSDRDVYLMDSTTLSEFIEDEGQKLVFIFDNLNERAFFMEVQEFILGKNLDAPVCTKSQGKAPKQEIGLEQMNIELPKVKSTSTMDIYDDTMDGYDDDDIASLNEKDEFDF